MINTLTVRNFKSFRDASINVAPLTLLTGVNGMGKSTFIQSLLLLRQSYLEGIFPRKGLSLVGNYIEIGKGKDALSMEAKKGDNLGFDIKWGDNSILKTDFTYYPDSVIQEKSSIDYKENEGIFDKPPFSNNFQYLNAERVSPKAFFPSSIHDMEQSRSLGIHGEYTTYFLSQNKNVDIYVAALKHPKAVSNTLISNVVLWLNELIPGINVSASTIDNAEISRLGYQFNDARFGKTDMFRPVNVGFGVTYTLPIIVAILSAKVDDLIIIENPESHLHPKAQSILGKLFAIAANAGVQIIIESHSDHILNSLRVCVKNKIISNESVAIYYFERKPDSIEHITDIVHPMIQPDGRLDSYPDGFFDEYDKHLDMLLS